MNYINDSQSFTPAYNDSGHNKSFLFVHQHQSNESLFDRNKSDSNETGIRMTEREILILQSFIVRCFIPSFYIFISFFSLPLNALAWVTFIFRSGPKSPSIIFMSHLACVDLLFTLLLPLKIHYRLNSSQWVFGEAACRVVSFAFYCYMYCSILLVMCMSVDRLLAVVYPVASLTWRSTRKASLVSALVWLLAFICSVPSLMIKQTYQFVNVGATCYDMWDFTDYPWQFYLFMFSILPSIFFFLPLIITLVSYSTIIYVLCVKNIATLSSSSSKKKRAVIMTTAVLIEFLVCFAPSNVILLYDCIMYYMGAVYMELYSVYRLSMCLGSASVFLDPLLYYYGSSQYRKKIWSVFRKTRRESSSGNFTE